MIFKINQIRRKKYPTHVILQYISRDAVASFLPRCGQTLPSTVIFFIDASLSIEGDWHGDLTSLTSIQHSDVVTVMCGVYVFRSL